MAEAIILTCLVLAADVFLAMRLGAWLDKRGRR